MMKRVRKGKTEAFDPVSIFIYNSIFSSFSDFLLFFRGDFILVGGSGMCQATK